MPTLTLTLPRPHPAQRQVIREARRFNGLSCGRRWGKTILGEDRLIEPALGGWPVGWFSPTYKMLSEVWLEVERILAPVTRRKSVQQHRLELVTGGVIDMWSLDHPDAARGRKYRRVVIDEAAMIRALQPAWQAVIRPTLVDYEGDAWFLSTPKGFTFFKTIWDWGQDPGRPEWMSWQMPTAANPFIKPSEIEAARRELPERTFAQEILAQFLEDGGGVFRGVLAAATAEPQAGALPDHEYAIGIDWGKLEDFTVLTVLDTTARQVAAIDRFNRIDYAFQLSRLDALVERFRPRVLIPEQNSMGVPLVEQLQRRGYYVLPFQTTNASKAQAIEALALALERGDLAILNDPVLVAELQAYEAERLPSGLLRYGAPDGQHDDCVMSLALAWQAVAAGPSQGVWLE